MILSGYLWSIGYFLLFRVIFLQIFKLEHVYFSKLSKRYKTKSKQEHCEQVIE